MTQLYIKNYKGFSSQVIDILDFNFLVGENSTGKTSILKLISLVSSPEFWFNMEFNVSTIELGYFEEILKNKCGDDYFSIGVNVRTGKVGYRKLLLTFTEKDSIPKISKLKIGNGEEDVFVDIKEKQIRYRLKKHNESFSFLEWCEDQNYPKEYKIAKRTPEGLPFGMFISYIASTVSGSKPSLERFNIYPLIAHLTSLAPIRAKVKRTYDGFNSKFSPEGEHIPVVLKNILANSSKKEEGKIIKSLEKFGSESNLFDNIKITPLGNKPSSPFEISILYGNMPIRIGNVGYGVSQVLPLIVEVLAHQNHHFVIQQPEVHLHPKAQAAFGEFIYQMYEQRSNRFIIETHSDYMINRFRLMMSKKKSKDNNPSSQILFFERNKNDNIIHSIVLEKDGDLPAEVPSSYRDFFIIEELQTLSI